MSDFRNYLNKQMENREFRAEYEGLEPEFSIIQAVIDARKSHNNREIYTSMVKAGTPNPAIPAQKSWHFIIEN